MTGLSDISETSKMRMIIIAAIAASGAIGSATAQEASGKADPRAVDECMKDGAAFTTIAQCLPSAHAAFAMFDAFDEIYSAEAQPLKERCIELNDGVGINDGIIGAPICIEKAIEDALSLVSSLPEGLTLPDPIFNAVSDRSQFDELIRRTDEAKAVFPNPPMNAVMYMPYK